MLLGQRSQVEYVVLVAACFPLTLLVSKYLFEHVEKRFNKHGRAVAERLHLHTNLPDNSGCDARE